MADYGAKNQRKLSEKGMIFKLIKIDNLRKKILLF